MVRLIQTSALNPFNVAKVHHPPILIRSKHVLLEAHAMESQRLIPQKA